MLILGRAIGRTQAAEQLVRTLQGQLEDVRNHAPAHRLCVYCETWPSPPLLAGNWVPEIIDIAGGRPVGGVHANPGAPLTVDALTAADPDLLVFHWCNQDERFDINRISERPGWANVRALQTRAYAYLPGNLLNRPGPRVVDGARQLQALLFQHQRVH